MADLTDGMDLISSIVNDIGSRAPATRSLWGVVKSLSPVLVVLDYDTSQTQFPVSSVLVPGIAINDRVRLELQGKRLTLVYDKSALARMQSPDNTIRINGVDYQASGRLTMTDTAMTTESGGGFMGTKTFTQPIWPLPSGWQILYTCLYATSGTVMTMVGGIQNRTTKTPTLVMWSPTSATRSPTIYWQLVKDS